MHVLLHGPGHGRAQFLVSKGFAIGQNLQSGAQYEFNGVKLKPGRETGGFPMHWWRPDCTGATFRKRAARVLQTNIRPMVASRSGCVCGKETLA